MSLTFGKTLPFFPTSFVYGTTTYPLSIVGTDPSIGGSTTVIPDEIIPLKFKFADGTVLDANTLGPVVEQSPLFQNNTYAAGSTQYGDALMRSEFWAYAAAEDYHVLLGTPTLEPTMTVNVGAQDGYVITGVSGKKTGVLTWKFFIGSVEPQLLSQLNIDPTTLAMFVSKSTKVLEQGGGCCFTGIHHAFTTKAPAKETFTTVWSSVSRNSISGLSHEVGEWLNDPFYTNGIPPWINPRTHGCGGNKLEVGDPLLGVTTVIGGFQVQDVAFYSWFSRTMPSIGINGSYDLLEKFSEPAAVCP